MADTIQVDKIREAIESLRDDANYYHEMRSHYQEGIAVGLEHAADYLTELLNDHA